MGTLFAKFRALFSNFRKRARETSPPPPPLSSYASAMMEIFVEIANGFQQKSSIIDIRLGSNTSVSRSVQEPQGGSKIKKQKRLLKKSNPN